MSFWVAAIHVGRLLGDILGRDYGKSVGVLCGGSACVKLSRSSCRRGTRYAVAIPHIEARRCGVALFCVDCFRSKPYNHMTLENCQEDWGGMLVAL